MEHPGAGEADKCVRVCKWAVIQTEAGVKAGGLFTCFRACECGPDRHFQRIWVFRDLVGKKQISIRDLVPINDEFYSALQ